jgi:cell division protein FtsI (penicillin-binding protein 3)
MVAVVVALIVRLTVVQVLDGSRYAAYAQDEVEQQVSLPATRGPIYDRNGDVLAVSVPRADVIADDFFVTNAASEARSLAPLLGVKVQLLRRELSEKSGYVVLARQIDTSRQDWIQSLNFDSLTFIPDSLRVSPAGSLFQPILGGVYASGHGNSGLEYALDNTLSGTPGSEILSEAPGGVTLPSAPQDVVEPKQGMGVALTIDEPLQLEATKDVAAQMLATHAASGIAVIMNVHTGAILAMVDLVTGPHGKIVPASENLAVTSVYQPGSVMKLATVSYALQDGLISPTTVFTVPDELDVDGYTFQDASYHPTEAMCVASILAQSSNIGTILISRGLGLGRLSSALHAFGFGQPTGLDWPGESPGIIGSPATWYGSASASVPIGTGVAVTAMQVLDAYNAVANDGVLVEPHIVGGSVSANGTELLSSSSGGRHVLTPETVSELVPMLEGVVQDGTAVLAQIPGFTVAGKTGTAQVPNPNESGYLAGDWNATFVGFVPAQAPQLSGIVVLNHPQPIYGGTVAAPVFSKIMGYALRRFNVAPPSNQASGVPSCAGSNSTASP